MLSSKFVTILHSLNAIILQDDRIVQMGEFEIDSYPSKSPFDQQFLALKKDKMNQALHTVDDLKCEMHAPILDLDLPLTQVDF